MEKKKSHRGTLEVRLNPTRSQDDLSLKLKPKCRCKHLFNL